MSWTAPIRWLIALRGPGARTSAGTGRAGLHTEPTGSWSSHHGRPEAPALAGPGNPERRLELALEVAFRDRGLLRQALTHRSFVHEYPGEATQSNERLEFLGDAFIGLVIAEELFSRFEDLQEGTLTELRSGLVRGETLAGLAARFRLGDCLYLGNGEEQTGGRARGRNLAGAFEAVIGALLVDQGHEVAKARTLAAFEHLLGAIEPGASANYKSMLQEHAQAAGRPLPIYETVDEAGPPHARRFTVRVLLEGEVLGEGTGQSKRRAEQVAARAAHERLKNCGDSS